MLEQWLRGSSVPEVPHTLRPPRDGRVALVLGGRRRALGALPPIALPLGETTAVHQGAEHPSDGRLGLDGDRLVPLLVVGVF